MTTVCSFNGRGALLPKLLSGELRMPTN